MTKQRDDQMTKFTALLTAAVAAALVAAWGSGGAARQISAPAKATPAASVPAASAPSVGRATYHLVKEWAPTPPYPTHDWEMSSVTVDPDGRRVYATRRSDPPILEIDGRTGKV